MPNTGKEVQSWIFPPLLAGMQDGGAILESR